MNNGVTNNTTTQATTTENTLASMAGVKLAPVAEGPVDASSKESATSTVQVAVNTANYGQAAPQQVVPQTPSVESQQTPTTSPVTPTVVEPPSGGVTPPTQPTVQEFSGPPPSKRSFAPVLLIIIIGLVCYVIYSTNAYNERVKTLTYNCTPVTSAKEDKELDLNSTLVKDLYSKVVTNIREDIAQPEFNDNMKLYLAYRQISDELKYDSNCNLFNNTAMEPYTCEETTRFKPRAIDEDVVKLEIKKLFGEKTEIPLTNIRLGSNSCIGGYQYIPERGQFVEGLCLNKTATSFKVTKKLIKATSNRNTIILTEEVKYHEAEKVNLPDILKSGIYTYTFRLDMNYNYILVSKTYQTKY